VLLLLDLGTGKWKTPPPELSLRVELVTVSVRPSFTMP
jgi:hypothetical protein